MQCALPLKEDFRPHFWDHSWSPSELALGLVEWNIEPYDCAGLEQGSDSLTRGGVAQGREIH